MSGDGPAPPAAGQPDTRYDAPGSFPSQADAVVVGGGVAGTAVAHQLSKRGKSVVLVDMRGICSGASGRNAGHTGSRGSSLASSSGRAIHHIKSENFRMIRDELRQELDDDFDLRVTGAVDIATTGEQWDYLVTTTAAAGQLDDGIRLIDRRELQELIPAASDALLGAQYSAHSGHLWPFRLVHGLANGARNHGARIFPWTPVSRILTSNGTVTGVETERGAVETDTVVLATNAWTPKLLSDLPDGAIVPARGQIIATQPVPAVLPLTFGTNFDKEYGRQTATGQLICGGFRRYDVDEGLGHYDEHSVAACVVRCAECLATMFPQVSPVRVVRAWAGIMGFTADGLPLIGPYDAAKGLYLSAGYNGGGFSWGPAAGKALAELIVDGNTGFNLEPFNPNRFVDGDVDWRNPSTAGEQNNPKSMAELRTAK